MTAWRIVNDALPVCQVQLNYVWLLLLMKSVMLLQRSDCPGASGQDHQDHVPDGCALHQGAEQDR